MAVAQVADAGAVVCVHHPRSVAIAVSTVRIDFSTADACAVPLTNIRHPTRTRQALITTVVGGARGAVGFGPTKMALAVPRVVLVLCAHALIVACFSIR